MFDLRNIPTAHFLFEAWEAGEVGIAPPMRPFQEEKLALALFRHHLLRDYWREALGGRHFTVLDRIIPAAWVVDTTPLPPGAVLDGPLVGGRAMADWRELAGGVAEGTRFDSEDFRLPRDGVGRAECSVGQRLFAR